MDGWSQLQNTYLTSTEQQNVTREGGEKGRAQGGFETLKLIPDREGGNWQIGGKNMRGHKMRKVPCTGKEAASIYKPLDKETHW